MFIDTHCHLNFFQFKADTDAVLARARAAGVERVLVPGADLESSRRAVALAEQYAEVYAAVGVHPTSSAGFSETAVTELAALARHPKVVAVGEIGIDLYWKTVPLADQQAALRAQLQLALDLNLPVMVHDREAHAEVLAALQAQALPAGGVLHAFSGDRTMAEQVMAAGFYLSVAGPLTYKKNDALRAFFASAPLERILIETDAPYLAPQGQRGRRNEPAYVRGVAEKLAEIRQLEIEEVAQATTANAGRLFGVKIC